MVLSALAPLHCEITACEPLQASVLAEVSQACARDLGRSLEIVTIHPTRTTAAASSPATVEAAITLHLPAEWAASQHEVWCLACRLACFCPSTRVSVLVTGAFTACDTAHVQPGSLSA